MKPLSEQIKAVQLARSVLKANGFHELDQALNDAGSTLAALNLNPDHFEQDEYFEQLEELMAQWFENDNPTQFLKIRERILSISYDRVVELENKLEAFKNVTPERVIESSKTDKLI